MHEKKKKKNFTFNNITDKRVVGNRKKEGSPDQVDRQVKLLKVIE
jgi:hypothetical protein